MEGLEHGPITLDKALEQILPTQKKYLECDYKYADYIGGEGSGKTIVLCLAAILLGDQDPGGVSIIGRATLPSLKVTTRKQFLELFPRDWCANWEPNYIGAGRLIHKNGHEYYFLHLDMDDAEVKSHIRSMNISKFYCDEGSEIKHNAFLTLQGRLRRGDNKKTFRCGRVTSNANGRDWQWEEFFDDARPSDKKKWTTGFLAPSDENIHLPEDYLESRLATYPRDWAERFLHASFSDFSDKIYEDWNHGVHVYDASQKWDIFNGESEPPDDWPVIIGIDIGGADPWSISFIARKPDESGFLFKYAEIYRAGILIKDILEEFWAKLGRRRIEGMAYDYENQQAALEMAALGLPGQPANKDVLAGIFKFAQYLHPDPRMVHPFTGAIGCPRYFVSSACRNTIRELPGYSWAKDRRGNKTGKPRDGDDHSCDSDRYAIHTFRPEPKNLKEIPAWANPKLDEMSRMYWRDVERQKQRAAVVTNHLLSRSRKFSFARMHV